MIKTRIYLIVGLFIFLSACSEKNNLFEEIDPARSGVHFSNRIMENDTMNILEYEYIYNGGGLGLGDFDNDGIDDIFVTGNMADNALYLNKGDFKFVDVSQVSGIASYGQWSSGVAVVDINGDGWQDIYVCNTTHKSKVRRKNNLYIHQGLDSEGRPFFNDLAEEYGLADDSYSVNAAFFDYDNDLDLDVIIIINEMGDTRFHSQYRDPTRRGYFQRIDRLYRNDGTTNGHPVFVDVSAEAGIKYPGFSLGVNISDLNKDGWKDIYISNDFLSDDLIYINLKNGTFRESAKEFLKHTSHSAMGNDVVDINNDGYDDIIALDMLPEGNYRQKKLLGETSYNSYLNNERFGYSYQYVRNTLQLNNGIDSSNQPQFSDISLFAGISATDWSWTPLVADFDNDGFRDLIVTNGFPKDVTDHDFIDYRADASRFASKELIISQIPSAKIGNYAYRNQGDLTFKDVSEEWGVNKPSYSNGAVYGDLDGDGDLDLVINNINDSLSIFRNHTTDDYAHHHYLTLSLHGYPQNPDAIGSQVLLKCGKKAIFYEHSIYRGYLSSQSKNIHFGLGDADSVNQILITWPDGKQTSLRDLAVNQSLVIDYNDPSEEDHTIESEVAYSLLTHDEQFSFKHPEEDYIDYNVQPLLPHKLSQYGPSISVGDINGDGLDDLYVGGSAFYHGIFIIQTKDGGFRVDTLKENDARMEELGTILLDADSDGDLDLFIAGGSFEFNEGDTILQDRLFENIGGRFKYRKEALPQYFSNALNTAAADYDRDGDLDILVAGRVVTGEYPLPATSYLLKNVSSKDNLSFEMSDALDLKEIGMISDAIWSDINGDNWVDLIMVGELSGITVYKNGPEGFSKVDDPVLEAAKGFWNSITGADLDADGDVDYILGNLGLNTFMEVSKDRPYRIYVNDFDNNESMDALPFTYLKDQNGEYREFPFVSRMDFAKEINAIRKMLPSYHSYAMADVNTLITKETMENTEIFEANYPFSSILWNLGEEGFLLEALPQEAQIAPVYGSVVLDVNDDNVQDLVLVGNDFGSELVFGRMDAFNGLVLIGSPSGSFTPLTIRESGFYAPGDAKSLVMAVWDDKFSLITGVNKGPMSRHFLPSSHQYFTLKADDYKIKYETKDKSWVEEATIGNGFLSQSTNKRMISKDVVKITITDYSGNERIVQLQDM